MTLNRTNLDETQDVSPIHDFAFRGFYNIRSTKSLFWKKKSSPGENPAVVTDATCYMGWIAEQYGLRLPRDYKVKPSCTQHTGDVNDVNKRLCRWDPRPFKRDCICYQPRTSRGTFCDFTAKYPDTPYEIAFTGQTIDTCKLVGATGVSLNVNFCVDTDVSWKLIHIFFSIK